MTKEDQARQNHATEQPVRYRPPAGLFWAELSPSGSVWQIYCQSLPYGEVLTAETAKHMVDKLNTIAVNWAGWQIRERLHSGEYSLPDFEYADVTGGTNEADVR